MRRNIFEIAKENTDLFTNVQRLRRLFEKEDTFSLFPDITLPSDHYSFFKFISTYCFSAWKNRGLCFDFSDYLETIHYEKIAEDASNGDAETLLTFIELLYNFWLLPSWIDLDPLPQPHHNESVYDFAKIIMDDVLASLNYRIYEDAEKQKAIVVENDVRITAVAEIIDPELSLDVIRYNHFTLKGNLAMKNEILFRLGRDLEHKLKLLPDKYSQLKTDISELINSLDIRHNNTDPIGRGKYHPYVAEMSEEELENWYDELYQMLLFAYLALDNEERETRVNAFKKQIHQADAEKKKK